MQDFPNSPKRPKVKGPTVDWKGALDMARRSCAKFDEPAGSAQDLEKQSTEALELLTKRYADLDPRAFGSLIASCLAF